MVDEPSSEKNHSSFSICQHSFQKRQEKIYIGWVLETCSIFGCTGEWNGMLWNIQISKLFSKLFSKVEILAFCSPPSSYIQLSKSLNPSSRIDCVPSEILC